MKPPNRQVWNVVLRGTREASPSPLNGERAGVRGEQVLNDSRFSGVSATSPASQAEHSLDGLLAPASRVKLFYAQSGPLSVASSKTVLSKCLVISSTHPAPCLSLVGLESRVALHQAQGCSALWQNRNRDNAHQPCAVVGTCKRRSAGRGELPTAFSRPTWIFYAGCERGNGDSSLVGLTKDLLQFKRLLAISPLTLTLSPLRGEGNRSGRPGKLRTRTRCRRTLIAQL